MKIKREGTGFTEVSVRVLDLNDHDDWVFSQMLGLKHAAALEEGGSEFGASSLIAYQTCEMIRNESDAEVRKAHDEGRKVEEGEPDSPVHFAARILHDIKSARFAIEREEADKAARYAFKAGMDWATAQLKWQWDQHAMRGVRTLRSAAEGGNLKRGRYKPDTLPVLNEMDRLRSAGHSKSRAAALTFAKGLGTSQSANQALWKRHRGRWRDTAESQDIPRQMS